VRRVEADFSTVVSGGLVRASLRRFHGEPVVVGEQVEAFDDDEGLVFTGAVAEIDGGFAYLRMEWTAAEPAPAMGVDQLVPSALTFATPSITHTFSRCVALTA
jgi:hypothetical protein